MDECGCEDNGSDAPFRDCVAIPNESIPRDSNLITDVERACGRCIFEGSTSGMGCGHVTGH
jgi:hypothetical protein